MYSYTVRLRGLVVGVNSMTNLDVQAIRSFLAGRGFNLNQRRGPKPAREEGSMSAGIVKTSENTWAIRITTYVRDPNRPGKMKPSHTHIGTVTGTREQAKAVADEALKYAQRVKKASKVA